MKETLKFIWTSQKSWLIWALSTLIAVVIVTLFTNGTFSCNSTLSNWYGNFFDPITSVGVVLLAFLIWIAEMEQERREQLPKKLTVHFKIYSSQQYVLSCYYASLVNEGDIRGYAQQIGAQMVDEERTEDVPVPQRQLKMEPLIELKPTSTEGGVRLYTIEISLRSDENFPVALKNAYKIWMQKEVSKGKFKKLKKIVEGRPLAPLTSEELQNPDLFNDGKVSQDSNG